MSRYRRVQVAGDELVHFAAMDTDHTIGCKRAVVTERGMVSDDRPRCGQCLVEWMAATGQIRLVTRLPTAMPPKLTAKRRSVER